MEQQFEIPKTMKAVALAAYDKLELIELPVPEPGSGEVLCKIKSIAICGSDPKLIHGGFKWSNLPPYFPFVMGHEWAGQVVKVGEGVTEFKVGDRVAGEAHVGCGVCENCKNGHYTVCLNYGKDGHDGGVDMGHRHYGFHFQGANAEYNAYKVKALHKLPDNVSYDLGSLCDTAGCALHGVELAGVTKGGTSVVIGPGAIGLCAMMECKAMGSGRVIMVGRGKKLELAKELGADICIDFEKDDPVEKVLELTNGVGADEVMECSGAADSPYKGCKMLKKTGTMSLMATYNDIVIPANVVNFNELRIRGSRANPGVSEKCIALFASGKYHFDRLITHNFSLEDYEKAVDIFEHRKDGSIKVVINPEL